MSIAVVGFDIGYQTSYISVAKGGGIETIVNEFSDRCTPVCVSFLSSNRCIGTSAKQQSITNFLNTVSGCFTRLIGLMYDDPLAQAEISINPNKFVQLDDGRVGVSVKYLEQEAIFSMEQLYAMQLTKLKGIAEAHLGTKVVDIVLNIPVFFSDIQRRSVLDACEMAGCNCLRLLHDTTAAGIAFGLYNKELPAPDQPPKIVAFIDMGSFALQATIVTFNEGKMKVLASNSIFVGGRTFDQRLCEHFQKEISKKYKLNVAGSVKARTRLMQEVEKLKKLMNANSKPLPLNIECFMEDTDVSGSMCRADMESLCEDVYDCIIKCMEGLMSNACLQPSDIHDVELVGGAGRMTKVREVIEKFFGNVPKTHLNADEAVARGCSLQSAILSPAFRVKDFTITDALTYSISVAYEEPLKGLQTLELFPQWHGFPFSRQVTLMRRGDFWFRAFYTASGEEIGVYQVTNVPDESEEGSKVKLKARVNMHGIFSLSQALLLVSVEKEVDNAEVKTDESPKTDVPLSKEEEGEKKDSPSMEKVEDQNNTGEEQGVKDKSTKTMKKVTKTTELPVAASIHRTLTRQQVMEMTERENGLIAQDRLEHDRAVAKNAVEEYAYDMQDKLGSGGSLVQFCSDTERGSFLKLLEAAVDWIYDEGEDLPKQQYITKIEGLKKQGEPIVQRARQAEGRARECDLLGNLFVRLDKELEAVASGDERYGHLSAEEVNDLSTLLQSKRQWLTTQMAQQSKRAKFEDPLLTMEAIRSATNELEGKAKTVLNKPKPKVEPPPPATTTEAATPNNANDDCKNDNSVNGTKKTPPANGPTGAGNECAQDMDID